MERSDVESIIESKLENMYKVVTLETEKHILQLRDELKKDRADAIKEAIMQARERTNWSIEVLRLAMTIGALVGALKFA